MTDRTKPAGRELVVFLTRLPDVDSPRAAADHGLARYGRFALTRGGSFWFAYERSSPPPTTAVGWYWAVAPDRILLVSALDGQALFGAQAHALAALIERLVRDRIISKPATIRKEER